MAGISRTGQDYGAPYGTPVVAARGGTVVHVNYGNLGSHQFVIRPGDGTEDFYAHCGSRPSNGAVVSIGQQVAVVDAEGNTTGPHLHLERHTWYGWSCSGMDDPMKSHNYQSSAAPSDECSPSYPKPTSHTVYLSKLRYGQKDSDSVWYLQDRLNGHSLQGGHTLPTTGCYLGQTDAEVILCQQQHLPPSDPPGQSYVGPKQAAHLFDGMGITVVDDV